MHVVVAARILPIISDQPSTKQLDLMSLYLSGSGVAGGGNSTFRGQCKLPSHGHLGRDEQNNRLQQLQLMPGETEIMAMLLYKTKSARLNGVGPHNESANARVKIHINKEQVSKALRIGPERKGSEEYQITPQNGEPTKREKLRQRERMTQKLISTKPLVPVGTRVCLGGKFRLPL